MPIGESTTPSSLRRPCAADRFAAQSSANGYLKVPFARCADGVARHVTAVTGLPGGPFTCLDCQERLTLRRPANKRAHFAHLSDSLCTGETALHLYAKELLAQRRTLTLPALILQDEGLSEIVFKTGSYEFEQVLPERNLGTFQPDAIVLYKGAELAVEFLVSHAVDAEKRAKVLERNISMVEIDLSSVRAGSFSADELDHAILHAAPRRWIHHRGRAAAINKLEAQVATKRIERGRRLKWHIEKRVEGTYPEGWADEATVAVKQAELKHLVDIEVDCGHWFTVPRAIWQAHVLDLHVIKPSRMFAPGGRSIAVKGDWPHEQLLASKLPDWMMRTDLSNYPAKRLGEAGYDQWSYGSPSHAVWHYFAALQLRGEAVVWSREDQSFFIEPEIHGRLYRRVELPRSVTKLLGAVQHNDPETGYRRWASTYIARGATPAELIENGGHGYDDLVRKIAAIDAMLPSYSRNVVDDLCGLPLEPIRHRNLAAIAADAAERERKAREASYRRSTSLRRQAVQMLESDAAEWLGQQVEPAGVGIVEFASGSDDMLFKAERWLAAAADKRRQTISIAQHVAALRNELTQVAHRAFPSSALADLFLNSGQPKLGGRRPIDYCDSKQAFERLMLLLPKRR